MFMMVFSLPKLAPDKEIYSDLDRLVVVDLILSSKNKKKINMKRAETKNIIHLSKTKIGIQLILFIKRVTMT